MPAPADQPTDAHPHPDLLTASEAITYLRLDVACPTPAAAVQALGVLCRTYQLSGIVWGKERLYGRSQLDGCLLRAVEAAEAARAAQLDLTDTHF